MANARPHPSAFLSPAARQDVRSILRWSEEKFSKATALRYEALLIQAVRDVGADPMRPGTKQRRELPEGVMTYHLAFSRSRVAGGRVKEPRHFLAYRVTGIRVEIVRILHDGNDLKRHLPLAYEDAEDVD